MARNSLKNVMKLIDIANNELPIEKQFLLDLTNSIEKNAEENARMPSKTYKPSSMNCERQMVYQVLGVEPDKRKASYQSEGITESGTDRHIRIQKAIANMKSILGVDCEYIDVETFINQRNIPNLEVKEKDGMETKLYNTKYNMSFRCDGIVRYKGKYFVFEFKTETADKFYARNDVDPSHYNQAAAYSINFNLDDVLFVYENRNTCDKKSFMRHITSDMKNELIGKLDYCDSFVSKLKAPPKPQNVSKKACSYCLYKNKCNQDCY